MNILIIGNGFDLAHGLPTKYEDFLNFIYAFKWFNKQQNKFTFDEKNKKFKDFIHDLVNKETNAAKRNELYDLIEENSWIEYFEKSKKDGGWVDFERDISKVIQALDRIRKKEKEFLRNIPNGTEFQVDDYDRKIIRNLKILNTSIIRVNELEKIKIRLLGDLNKVTRCLEIYLEEFGDNFGITMKLPDIEELGRVKYILSFNYTHTFQRLYQGANEKIDYDYIHGEIKQESDLKTCNLILGIDEYLDQNLRNQDNEYIQFKKFFQRIYKKTGCKYIDWKKSINAGCSSQKHNIFIYGHSLDVTDGDILKDLIEIDNAKTTIFYHSQEALGKQIANLVKIIGENELISMVHGEDAKIVFKKQKDAVPTNI